MSRRGAVQPRHCGDSRIRVRQDSNAGCSFPSRFGASPNENADGVCHRALWANKAAEVTAPDSALRTFAFAFANGCDFAVSAEVDVENRILALIQVIDPGRPRFVPQI